MCFSHLFTIIVNWLLLFSTYWHRYVNMVQCKRCSLLFVNLCDIYWCEVFGIPHLSSTSSFRDPLLRCFVAIRGMCFEASTEQTAQQKLPIQVVWRPRNSMVHLTCRQMQDATNGLMVCFLIGFVLLGVFFRRKLDCWNVFWTKVASY